MLARNCTPQDLENALSAVNAKFDGNIRFKKIERVGKNTRFTLTVNSSKGRGARLGPPNYYGNGKQRRISAACWHAHGEFFDALPQGAVVIARGERIEPGDHWRDSNIGSQMYPFYFSEACECDR